GNGTRVRVDADFDPEEALIKAANQALTRALSATPIVTKPSDVKALIDRAANAMKMVEAMKVSQMLNPGEPAPEAAMMSPTIPQFDAAQRSEMMSAAIAG